MPFEFALRYRPERPEQLSKKARGRIQQKRKPRKRR